MRRSTTNSIGFVAVLPLLCMIAMKGITTTYSTVTRGWRHQATSQVQGWELAHAIQAAQTPSSASGYSISRDSQSTVSTMHVTKPNHPKSLLDYQLESAQNLRGQANTSLANWHGLHRIALPIAFCSFLTTFCCWLLVDNKGKI